MSLIMNHSVGLAVFLLFIGQCHCQGNVENLEAYVGERVNLTYSVGSDYYPVSWNGTNGTTTEYLYRYENGIINLTYPEKHEGQMSYDGRYLYTLFIKSAEIEDSMLYVADSDYGYSKSYTVKLTVYGMDNSWFANIVVPYNDRLHLAAAMNMTGENSMQWTYQEQNSSIVRDIYYRKLYYGGVLPSYSHLFKESSRPYGVLIDRLSPATVGKYKYFALEPPNMEQKEFSVTGTMGLECKPASYIIEGEISTHSCSAYVSNGNVVPVFTWSKNWQTLQGKLIYSNTGSPYGALWTYQYEFEAKHDDVNATFTCDIEFKYDGIPGPFEDTSDPSFTESCNVEYHVIEYPVRNTQISLNSKAGPLIVRVGQSLECSADGYPEISYNWDCGMGNNSSGPIHTIRSEYFENDVTSCSCTASNRLSDLSTHIDSSEISFRIAHESGILDRPADFTFVRVGESVTLDCTSALFINASEVSEHGTDEWDYQWSTFFSNNEDTKNILYYATKETRQVMSIWQNEYSLGDDEHNLVIKSATYDLAGEYACQVINYPSMSTWQGQVIVTDSVHCIGDTLVELGEEANLTCMLEYSGSLDPEMQLYADDVLLQGLSWDLATTKKSKTMSLATKVKVEVPVNYRCVIKFSSANDQVYKDECKFS